MKVPTKAELYAELASLRTEANEASGLLSAAMQSAEDIEKENDRLTAERDSLRDEVERMREALPRIADSLRKAGASLPAPENKGTVESAMQTGLSIALLLVEDELAALSASGREWE